MNKIAAFLPILAFFIAYKFFGIFIASAVMATITILEIISKYIKTKTISKLSIFNAVMICSLTTLTVTLQNPIFIKMKPTFIYSGIGIFLLVDIFLLKKFYIQKLYSTFVEQNLIQSDDNLWYKLSLQWSICLFSVAALNECIWRTMDEQVWVNFKVFGIPLIVVLVFITNFLIFNKKAANKSSDVG